MRGCLTATIFAVLLIMATMFQVANGPGLEAGYASENRTFDRPTDQEVVRGLTDMPGHFTENAGLLPSSDTRFLAQGDPMSVGLAPWGLTFALRSIADGDAPVVSFDLVFEGCNVVEPRGSIPTGHVTSFLLGNDPDQWVRDARDYTEVWYWGIYDGVDLRFYFLDGVFKYDLYMEPGVDPTSVQLRYDGVRSLSLDEDTGDLLVSTSAGTVVDSCPVAYQPTGSGNDPLGSSYRLLDGTSYTFHVSTGWDMERPIVIDPGMEFSTLLGGQEQEHGYDILMDPLDRILVVGSTNSGGFPTTTGAFCETLGHSSGRNAFVCILDTEGQLLRSTFIGGLGSDVGSGIQVSPGGDIIVSGWTDSLDFPVTASTAIEASYMGGIFDCFLVRMDGNCSDILYGTYFGGSQWDLCNDLRVSSDGSVFVVGTTNSTDLPVTPNAYCSTHQAPWVMDMEAFAMKFNGSLTRMDYCTYLGQMEYNENPLIGIASNGVAYIAGTMGFHWVEYFETTPGAYCTTLPDGWYDNYGFVLALSPDCEMLYSTFFGVEGVFLIRTMDVTSDGKVLVSGITKSKELPVTEDAHCHTLRPNPSFAYTYGYIAVLDGTLAMVDYCTYLDGDASVHVNDVAWCESEGKAYVYGTLRSSSDLPYTLGAFDFRNRGERDCYVMGFDLDDGSLCYSTYLGGEGDDHYYSGTYGKGLATTADGRVLLTYSCFSDDFPTTPGSHQRVYQGNGDAFAVMIDPVPCDVMDAPVGLDTTPGDEQVYLRWTKVSKRDSRFDQYVYRGTTAEFSEAEVVMVLDWDANDLLDIDVFNGVTYNYWIVLENSAGRSMPSEMASCMPYGWPGAPTNLSAATGDRTVMLNWTPPNETGGVITGYRVYRDPVWDEGSYNETTATNLTDLDVVCGTNYTYSVSAVTVANEGPLSANVSVVPVGPPMPPSDVRWLEGDGSVEILWDAPVELGGHELVGFQIFRGPSEDTMTLITNLDKDVRNYLDRDLENGRTYHYGILTVTAFAEASVRVEFSASPHTLPGAPVVTEATAGNRRTTLAWDGPIDDGGRPITDYLVSWGTDPDTLNRSMRTNSTTIEVADLLNGVTYYFEVRASNIKGEGPPSGMLDRVPLGVPGTPTDFDVQQEDDTVVLSWQRPSETGGAVSLIYRIFKGPSDDELSLLTELTETYELSDPDVVGNKTYYYQIFTTNGLWESPPTITFMFKVLAPPGPVVGLSVVGGEEDVTLSWSPPVSDGGSRVLGYVIMRGATTDNMLEYHRVATVLEFTDTSVEPGGTFYYYVVAYNEVGNGEVTQPLSGTRDEAPPPPPDDRSWPSDMLLYLLLLSIVVVAVTIIAQRRLFGRPSHGETGPGSLMAIDDIPVFIVEEAFLVYKDGTLIAHMARPDQEEADAGLMSGVLIAIQGIIQDGLEGEGEVESITFGENTIVMSNGTYVTLAASVYGQPSDDLKKDLRTSVTKVEDRHGGTLERWDGDPSSLKGAKRIINPLVEGTAAVDRSLVTMAKVGRKVTVLSAIDFHAGYVRLKIAAINGTPTQIIDASIEVHYDIDMLRLERVEPYGHDLRGDKVGIGNIKPGERSTISFLFDPQICHGTHIDAHIMYYDSKGEVHREEMKRRHAEVVCPIFFTRRQANTAMLRRLIRERLHMSDLKVFRYPEGLKPEEVLESAKLAMGIGDIQRVREYVVKAPNYEAEVWYYGTTKVKEYQMVMRLGVVERINALELFVASTAMEPVTGFIAEFRRELQSTVEWLHPEVHEPPEEEVRRDLEERELMLDTVDVEDDDVVVVVVEPPEFGGTM